jgi:hypothetical protein
MVSALWLASSAPTNALQTPLVHVEPGLQSAEQVPVCSPLGAQNKFHSHESKARGSQAAPAAPWPFGASHAPMSAVPWNVSHLQTVPFTLAHELAVYGSHCCRQTRPLLSLMQMSPALQVSLTVHGWFKPPTGGALVQVSAVVSQRKPLVQSLSARHCTHWRGETAVLQTGVPLGQQLLLAVHAGGTSQAGGFGTQVWLDEHTFVGSLQSASLPH